MRAGAAARAARTASLRSQLLAAQRNPLLDFPLTTKPKSAAAVAAGGGSIGGAPYTVPAAPYANIEAMPPRVQPQDVATNVVVFHRSSRSSAHHNGTRSGRTALQPSLPLTTPVKEKRDRKQALCVAPWLYVTTSLLDVKDLAWLASQRGVTRILEIALSKQALNFLHLQGSPAPSTDAEALVATAAALHRLVVRRGGVEGASHIARHTCVLLHCGSATMAPDVATLIAAWLHWYGGFADEEAVSFAAAALAAQPDQALLQEGLTELLVKAKQRASTVTLRWPYRGHYVAVAGDVVGGWGNRMPLSRCRDPHGCARDVHEGHWFLQISGLAPGTYHYKFIVDGVWMVDLRNDHDIDPHGNINNVLRVPDLPQLLDAANALAVARNEAMHQAFNCKLAPQTA